VSLVVDVDSHWEITAEGPGYFPVDDYRDGAPDHLATLRNALAGDVMRAVPAEMRPADRDLLAPSSRHRTTESRAFIPHTGQPQMSGWLGWTESASTRSS